MKFGNSIMNNEFISRETFELMLKMPDLENDGLPYGLGWYFFQELPNYGTVYAHPGSQTGASTLMMIMPEQDFFVIVLSNTSGASDDMTKIASKLFEIAFTQ